MTASQTVPRIPAVLHRDHTVIVCPYACDNVIHYHGAAPPNGGDSIVVPGHRVSHCYWYLPKQEWPADVGYFIIPATAEQERFIRDWLPRGEHLRQVKFRAPADQERRRVLASLIGEENLPPIIKPKLNRYLTDNWA